jgi:outer membrane protein assembly factor BamB
MAIDGGQGIVWRVLSDCLHRLICWSGMTPPDLPRGRRSMGFWPIKFRTVFLLALVGVGVWQAHKYLTATQDQLVAIDAKTGEILWNRSLQNEKPYYPPIPLSADRLLMTDSLEVNGKRTCFWSELNQQTGDVMWRKNLKELGLDGCPIYHRPGVAQDGQFYTFWEGRLWEGAKPGPELLQQAIVAMDFNNHQLRWVSPLQLKNMPMASQLKLAAYAEATLILRPSQIFAAITLVGNKEDEARIELKALKPETGNVIWQKQVEGHIGGGYADQYRVSALLAYNSSFIFALRDKKWSSVLSSYDMRTGKLESSHQEKYGDYIFQHKNEIYGYDTFSGNEIKKFSPDGGKYISSKLSALIPIDDPSCPNHFGFAIYPSKSNLVGLCRLNKVSYDDPESYRLFAVDDRTGKQQWQSHIVNDEDSLQPNTITDASGDRVFLSTNFKQPKSQKIIYQLQSIMTKNGKPEWRLSIDVLKKPALSGDRLFVITRLPRWQTLPITRPKPLRS